MTRNVRASGGAIHARVIRRGVPIPACYGVANAIVGITSDDREAVTCRVCLMAVGGSNGGGSAA